MAQDAQAWLKDGLMDQLYPMIYYKGNNFFPFAADWQEECHDRSVSAGLGIYFMSSCEGNWTIDMVRRQLYFLRSEGIGHCFFRCKFLLDNVQGIYDFVANELNRYPALIPPMTWAKCTPPSPPSSLAYDHKKRLLSWQPADSDTYLYNIYMSDNSSNGIHSPENMIAVRTAEKQIQIPPQHNLFDIQYAVTAIDRYGNESEPSVFTIKGIWKR